MRFVALLLLPSLALAAPVPKQPAKPNVVLKLDAESSNVLDITIQNNTTRTLELPYLATPFEHIEVELRGENGKTYTIRHTFDKDHPPSSGTLKIAVGKSETLSLHTCHSVPEVGGGQKITFTAKLTHGGLVFESEPLTVK